MSFSETVVLALIAGAGAGAGFAATMRYKFRNYKLAIDRIADAISARPCMQDQGGNFSKDVAKLTEM